MQHNLAGWEDTIVALATPHGIGAIGVIRLSGKRSFPIANALFPSKDLLAQPSHSLHVGFLKNSNGTVLDEAVLSLFKGPRSYTGEDLVEISCHGSPFVLQQVIQSCIGLGARLARAGEFTPRAFLNWKPGRTQAEAVADLIASNTTASQRSALHNIRGGFSAALKQLREELIGFSALIELELDFAEEDVAFADRDKLFDLVNRSSLLTSQLINSFQLGNVIKNGVSVAIIGKPNAGKSTLLNALLNEDRAIVSDIAGTTRDTIEETINIDGILFRFIDTAGIRDHSDDRIEQIGMEKSRVKISASDEVIYIFDVNTETPGELDAAIALVSEKNPNYLLVGNKTDLVGEAKASEKFRGNDVLFISAKDQFHLSLLKQQLVEKVLKGRLDTENTIITNARHFEALQQVQRSLEAIKKGLEENRSGDLLTPDIHQCLHYISVITGEVTNEDVLDYIFSKFCIGK